MSSRRTLVLFKLQHRHLTVLRAVDESTGILVSRGLHAYASRAVLPPCTSPLQPGRSRRVALPCGGHPGLAAAQDPHNTRRRMHHCATHPLSTFPEPFTACASLLVPRSTFNLHQKRALHPVEKQLAGALLRTLPIAWLLQSHRDCPIAFSHAALRCTQMHGTMATGSSSTKY